MFEPPRQQWCFRFEACYAYFKSLVPVIRNFKNMALTLSYRHQSRLCSLLTSNSGNNIRTVLYKGDYIAPGTHDLLCNLPYADIFRGIINESQWLTCHMMRSPKVTVHGTTYFPKSIILLQCSAYDLPIFGEVAEIFIFDKKMLLVIFTLQTQHFDFAINSYHVIQVPNAKKIVKHVKDLLFPHPLSAFVVKNKKVIPLFNHEHIEYYG